MKLNNGRIWFIAGITLSSIGSLCLSLACCLYAKRKNKATYDENNIIIDTTQIDDIEEGDIIGTTNAIELQTTTEGAPTSTI